MPVVPAVAQCRNLGYPAKSSQELGISDFGVQVVSGPKSNADLKSRGIVL